MEEQKLRETMVESEEIFSGLIMDVKRDRVLLPNGRQSVRELLRHVGAVCVVPVTDDGCVVVERQYRYPIDQVMTEIPAGKLDSPEEDRLSAAQRELREETGITADGFTGEIGECNEGVLEWIKKSEFAALPQWEGDRIFLRLLEEDAPFFSLKLVYEGDRLVSAALNGRALPCGR